MLPGLPVALQESRQGGGGGGGGFTSRAGMVRRGPCAPLLPLEPQLQSESEGEGGSTRGGWGGGAPHLKARLEAANGAVDNEQSRVGLEGCRQWQGPISLRAPRGC